MEEINSEDDGSDSDLVHNQHLDSLNKEINSTEQKKIGQKERGNVEKRKEREDDNIDEEDFITVNRRRNKILIRSESTEAPTNMRVDENKKQNNNIENTTSYEVCVTSLECLPKQMALAKMLRTENISGITRIKYKSFNKVLIQFEENKDANKLLECSKLKEMGYRCQKTNELSLSYGIVKGMDSELSEKELFDIIRCEKEIVSIKRLKRLNTDGAWVDSESARFCFKGNILPPYIYAYECRFKVEPYVFPVTQCSGCWQFGHVFKFCPTKKKLCPKCGGKHENCDITEFICLNCKGGHFVLDKKCPHYLKEKQIRVIMSEKQIPYRRALQLIAENRRQTEHRNESFPATLTVSNSETYSYVTTKALIHQEPNYMDTGSEKSSKETSSPAQSTPASKTSRRRDSKQRRNTNLSKPTEENEIGYDETQKEEISHMRDEQVQYRFEFKKIFFKINNICMSKDNLEIKINSIFKIIWEECKKLFISIITNYGYFQNFFSFING